MKVILNVIFTDDDRRVMNDRRVVLTVMTHMGEFLLCANVTLAIGIC